LKNLKTYIPSLLVSILLTFALLGTSALMLADKLADTTALTDLAEEKQIVSMVKTELTEHFEDNYNETGVPAQVYTDAITDEYISKLIEINISAGFEKMNGGKFDNTTGMENPALEESITGFFNDYAQKSGYAMDEKYEEYLGNTIENAYDTIRKACDIYKFETINKEGIFEKAGGIYRSIGKLSLAAAGASLLLIIVLALINMKSVSAVLYWTGVSALISGIIGIVPCLYLNATSYFDAFTIKQPYIFAAFTGLMYKAVDLFMFNQIIFASAGAVLIIAYAVVTKIKNKA